MMQCRMPEKRSKPPDCTYCPGSSIVTSMSAILAGQIMRIGLQGHKQERPVALQRFLRCPFSSPPVHHAAIVRDRAVGVQPRSIVDLRANWWARLVGGMGEAALTR
jgi:hypothetical protein